VLNLETCIKNGIAFFGKRVPFLLAFHHLSFVMLSKRYSASGNFFLTSPLLNAQPGLNTAGNAAPFRMYFLSAFSRMRQPSVFFN